jgi:hypothetical protein
MTAAEAAIEQNAIDPFAELERTSADAARVIKADPSTVYRLAGEIVVKAFRGKLDEPGSLEFLCISCGQPLADDSLVCRRCEPDFFPEREP